MDNTPTKEFFNTKTLAVDLETTGSLRRSPDPHRDKTLLVSMFNGESTVVCPPGDWLPLLYEAMDRKGVTTFFHNGQFDLRFLMALGYEGTPSRIWDTMIVEQSLTCGRRERVNLGSVAWRRVGITLDKSLQKSFIRHSGDFSDAQIEYSRHDVLHLIQIAKEQKALARKQNLMEILKLENDLIPVTAHMEYHGVLFDLKGWEKLKATELLTAREARQKVLLGLQLQDYTFNLFNSEVGGLNLNSHKKLKEALHRMGIKVPNTREATLLRYRARSAKAADVLDPLIEYKKAMKRIGFAYDKHVNPVTGQIHTDYNQNYTVTGRYSSSDPNLQNVPNRFEYRRLFIAGVGYVFIIVDYSQQEVRILAHVTQDEALLEACRESDVYLEAARIAYRDHTLKKNNPKRKAMKTGFLAWSYGASVETVAQTLGLKGNAAARFVNNLNKTFPKVKEWAQEQLEHVQERSYVTTIKGRRRWFLVDDNAGGSWSTESRNTPIQGSAAGMLKLAMLLMYRKIQEKGYDARLVLTVHDEVVASAANGLKEEVSELVVGCMEAAGAAYIPGIPTPVELMVSKGWGGR